MEHTMNSHGQEKHAKSKNAKSREAMADSVEDCVKLCLECFQSCSSLIPHCLEMGGKHASVDHIGLLSACASICETSAKFMMIGSEFHRDTCGICAEICTKCADECEELGSEDALMAQCADICRRCAESCQQMSIKPVF